MKENLVAINSNELKDFLTHIISNNRVIQEQNSKTPVAVEVIGESGIGKTSSVIQLAEELELDFVKLNLSQIEEIGDLVGFPIKQFEVKMNNETEWVDENMLQTYLDQSYTATGLNRMSYCPPEWISGKEGGGILLLDDWNRADMRFIQAVMELVDRQQYISWTLPKDWHIILTANPDDGEYMVSSIDVAQKTRFISVQLKYDVDCWAKWAEQSGIDGRCINFMLLHPELVSKEVNSRSVSMFFNSISSLESFDNSLPLIQMIGEGSVGPEFSSMFNMFINNKLDKLITPSNILTQDEQYVLNTLKSIMYDGDNYRADLASVLSTRLVNYLEAYAKGNKITKDVVNRLAKIVKEEIFSSDIAFNMIKSIYQANKAKFSPMMMDKVLVPYIMK